jgi:non-homologous end joining protein Ku
LHGALEACGEARRGYELRKEHHVPIDEDEPKAVKIESTHTVDITGLFR